MKEITYFGYARVSTDEQAKNGFSIFQQVSAIHQEADDLGVTLKEVFVDDGYSAINLKRTGMQRLLQALSADTDDKVLIVREPERIVRNIILKRSLQCVFEKYNVAVHCLNGSWDGTDSDADFVSDMRMLLGEKELKNISPRVIFGYIGSAEKGNYPISHPPRGYKFVTNPKLGKGNILVPDEIEAPVIVKVFETLATNQINLTTLARILNERKTLGRSWNLNKLSELIDNPIYYGHFKRTWYDSEDPSILPDVKQYWHDPEHHSCPLISKELWLKVQLVAHHRRNPTYHHYLFNHLGFCSECGQPLTCASTVKVGRKKKERTLYLYYVCDHCKKRINEQYLLDEFLKSYSLNGKDTDDTETIKRLERRAERICQRVTMLHSDYDDELLDEDMYKEAIKKAYIELKNTRTEITEIQKRRDKSFRNKSFGQKRRFIINCVDRIVVNLRKRKATFFFKI